MIKLEDVSVKRGTFGLEKLQLEVERGEYCVLMGKSGAGKTTILEMITGLQPTVAGRIFVGGTDVTDCPAAARRIGYVPQGSMLFPNMRVLDNLCFGLTVRGVRDAAGQPMVNQLIEMLGLGDLVKRWPESLSGGEQQRVALGRALVFEPRVLLLDEPLNSLDDESHAEMVAALRMMHAQLGVTVMHVTHHHAEADGLADRVIWLKDGRLSE